jgi:hypothetical protein
MVRAPEEVLPMRITSILITFIAAIAFTACSSGGGDDGGGGDIDANTGGDIDAAESPDAPGGNTATGLGQVCNAGAPCPTEAALCAELDDPANGGFCTLSCGMTPDPGAGTDPTPPAGGDATCQGAYNGASGTPACVIYGAAQAGQIPWYCGVLCGTSGTMNFGECPNGLTCNANLCDD